MGIKIIIIDIITRVSTTVPDIFCVFIHLLPTATLATGHYHMPIWQMERLIHRDGTEI